MGKPTDMKFIKYLPAVFVLPAIAAPIPNIGMWDREIMMYFQSLAVARLGFESFFVVTPFESRSALHLHSIIASPLVAFGFHRGPRVISLLAAIASIGILFEIGRRIRGPELGILSVAILWTNPIFIRLSSRSHPETLSIALTCVSILAILMYLDDNQIEWYLVSLMTLGFGIANHLWEATILLPLFAILLNERRYYAGIGTVFVGLSMTLIVLWITGLQPIPPGSAFQIQGIQNDPTVFFTTKWWLGTDFSLHPLDISQPVILIFSLGVVLWYGSQFLRAQDRYSLLISSWVLSGLSIPILLPLGMYDYWYYLWGLLAPLSLGIAWWTMEATSRISESINIRHIAYIFIGLSISYIIFFQIVLLAPVTGLTSSVNAPIAGIEKGEAVQAGKEIARYEVTEPSQIVFIGKWSKNAFPNGKAIARILVYSDILITERRIQLNKGSAPKLYSEYNDSISCTVRAIKSNSEIDVKPC